MGKEEHDHNTRVSVVEVDPRTMVDDDIDSDEEEVILIEKSPEQAMDEAIQEWRRFHYPKWVAKIIWAFFAFSLVNLVLTLDQWHSARTWNRPFDLYPGIKVSGGWQEDELRFAATCIGIAASCLSYVRRPSADSYKFIFLLFFASATLHCVSFGKDLYHLNRAGELEECNLPPISENIRKSICVFDRFRATVIFDIFCGVFGYLMSFFILYQALTGVVSRRRVFNESNGLWEKVVLAPDQDISDAFPKRYRRQRPFFDLACIFVVGLNVTLLALSITQMTGDLVSHRGRNEPLYNYDRTTPRDIYLLPGNQPNGLGHGVGRGGWPEVNSKLRLSTNAIALVVIAFMIQWRRDGRFAQLLVLLLLFSASALYITCLLLDYDEYDTTNSEGEEWAIAQGSRIVYHRYIAVIVFDGLCGFPLLLFSLYGLFLLASQARRPLTRPEGRDYGWWCFGEWAAKKAQKAHLAAIEES